MAALDREPWAREPGDRLPERERLICSQEDGSCVLVFLFFFLPILFLATKAICIYQALSLSAVVVTTTEWRRPRPSKQEPQTVLTFKTAYHNHHHHHP